MRAGEPLFVKELCEAVARVASYSLGLERTPPEPAEASAREKWVRALADAIGNVTPHNPPKSWAEGNRRAWWTCVCSVLRESLAGWAPIEQRDGAGAREGGEA